MAPKHNLEAIRGAGSQGRYENEQRLHTGIWQRNPFSDAEVCSRVVFGSRYRGDDTEEVGCSYNLQERTLALRSEFPRIVLIGNWRIMTPLEAKSYLDARVSEEEFLFAEEGGDEFEFWSGVFERVTLQ